MKITQRVRKIISFYEADNPGTKTNLARILMHGKLGGTGRILGLSADHGVENGPAVSFANNPQAYDPHYHYQFALDSELSAYAAPLGMLETGANLYAGSVPLVLKINNGNSLNNEKLAPSCAITASVRDALRLGCCAIGITIHPGSDRAGEMFEDFREIAEEAKASGLVVIAWAYPKGGFISRDGEDAIDICSYSAHISASLGAHIINLRLPNKNIEQPKAKKPYKDNGGMCETAAGRVRHIMQSAFNGRRIVMFSGRDFTDTNAVLDDAKNIREGGGCGSFIGRNFFMRPRTEALELAEKIIEVYATPKTTPNAGA